MYIHIYIYIYIVRGRSIYIYIYICIYVYMYICIYVYIHIHEYIHVYIYIYIYTHTYTHTHTYLHAYLHLYHTHVHTSHFHFLYINKTCTMKNFLMREVDTESLNALILCPPPLLHPHHPTHFPSLSYSLPRSRSVSFAESSFLSVSLLTPSLCLSPILSRSPMLIIKLLF